MKRDGAIMQSVCSNYDDIINITKPHNKSYANKINFDYILHKQFWDHDRHPSWNSIYSALYLLKQGYKYVLSLDGDAVVVNQKKHILDLCKEAPTALLHICSSKSMDGPSRCDGLQKKPMYVNAGVFLIKRDDKTIRFLEKIINTKHTQYHRGGSWEQAVMKLELNDNIPYYSKIVKIYKYDYFNHSSSWIFHPCIWKKGKPISNNKKATILKNKLKGYHAFK